MKKNIIKLLLVLFFIIIVSIIFISILSKKIMPIYINYSESEIEKIVTVVVNRVVNETNLNDNLFIVKNDVNQTTIVDYDPVVINKIISSISNNVYDNLKLIEQMDTNIFIKYNLDKSVFYVPSGIIFNSVMLNNLGPKIPLKLKLIGSVNPNIETKVTEYGINNSLIEVNIKVNTSIRMILPLSSKDKKITVVVPLTVKIIQGNIPEYYFGSLNKNNN